MRGFAPVAPGTFGTLLAFPMAWVLRAYAGDMRVPRRSSCALFAAGAWAAEVTGRNLGVPITARIVIDEIAAFLLVLFFVGTDAARAASRSCCFGVFDIVKPPPIRQPMRAMKNGVGVMLDDLLAAGYTLLVFGVRAAGGRMSMRERRADLRRVEESGLNAMQTQRQLFYDGWLLRVSPGKAKRARCVNALFGSTLPLAQKIAHCERVYADAGPPTLFRITPFAAPPDLDAELERGLRALRPDARASHAARRSAGSRATRRRGDIDCRTPSIAAFADAVGAMRGTTADQRAAHLERIANHAADDARLRRDGDGVGRYGPVTLETHGRVFNVVTAPKRGGRGHRDAHCLGVVALGDGSMARRTPICRSSADNARRCPCIAGFGFVHRLRVSLPRHGRRVRMTATTLARARRAARRATLGAARAWRLRDRRVVHGRPRGRGDHRDRRQLRLVRSRLCHVFQRGKVEMLGVAAACSMRMARFPRRGAGHGRRRAPGAGRRLCGGGHRRGRARRGDAGKPVGTVCFAWRGRMATAAARCTSPAIGRPCAAKRRHGTCRG